MANEFNAGGGRLLGTNDLQQTVDRFTSAVNTLTSTVNSMAQDAGGGMTRRPAASSRAEGATFTNGTFPSMGSWANQAILVGQSRQQASSAPSQPLGGDNAGGASAGRPRRRSTRAASGGSQSFSQTAIPARFSSGPGGATDSNVSTVGNGSVATPGGSASGMTWGGGSWGGYAPSGGGPGGGGNGTSGTFSGAPGGSNRSAGGLFSPRGAVAGTRGILAAFTPSTSTQNNMLVYNAYGTQEQAQWGGSAQTWQNNAFGYYNNNVNNAAQGNPAQAAAEWGSINSMTGGGAIGYGSMLSATNALAYANQGLGAGGAAQLASQVYNPVNSMRMQMLTGVSAINPLTGQDNSMSSIISGLASGGYIGGGGYNARTGTFNQQALNASFTAGRGTSYMNLSSMNYSPSQIQDLQSVISQANQAAVNGGTSFQNVMNLMNQAQGGPGVSQSQAQAAQSQLNKLHIGQSTVQQLGNLQSQNMAQQQGESSSYNRAVQDFTAVMKQATAAMSNFLDKTGLGKAVGAAQGTAAGFSSSGMASLLSKGLTVAGGVTSFVAPEVGVPMMMAGAAMGGGAASVSATQPMTSQGSRPGSSMSSVPAQVQTAVRDAEQQVGKPYVYGGSNPKTSFDCSGLVMWAYDQAGVRLPRTSEQQWAALKNKSVPLNSVREGDIVFSAGSDGSASAPGHEALMISGNQIIEAPYTGANIRVRSFNPGEWQHAARPVGTVSSAAGKGTAAPVSTGGPSRLMAGNSGAPIGGNGDSSLGLTSNADSMLFAGGATGTALRGAGTTAGAGGTGMRAGSGASGPAPNLPNNTSQTAWINQLFKSLSVPSSAANIASLKDWMAHEEPQSDWNHWNNPMNTTQNEPGAKSMNSVGVKQYPSLGAGLAATVATLKNGDYGDILSALKSGNGLMSGASAGLRTWSGGAYHAVETGGTIIVGERGPEAITLHNGTSANVLNAKDTANLLRGNTARPAQAPYASTPAAQLLYDRHPANNAAPGRSGGVTVNLTVEKGAFTVGGTGISTTSDVQSMAEQFGQAVEDRLAKSQLLSNIAAGVTG